MLERGGHLFKKQIAFLFLILVLFSSLVGEAFAHPGGTDSGGGHTDRRTGEYHYHHGYSAHDHYDMDGDGIKDCPYDFKDNTDHHSNSSVSIDTGSFIFEPHATQKYRYEDTPNYDGPQVSKYQDSSKVRKSAIVQTEPPVQETAPRESTSSAPKNTNPRRFLFPSIIIGLVSNWILSIVLPEFYGKDSFGISVAIIILIFAVSYGLLISIF